MRVKRRALGIALFFEYLSKHDLRLPSFEDSYSQIIFSERTRAEFSGGSKPRKKHRKQTDKMTSLLDYRQISKILDTSLSHINCVDSVLSFKAAKVVLDHEIKNAIKKEREILDTGSKG